MRRNLTMMSSILEALRKLSRKSLQSVGAERLQKIVVSAKSSCIQRSYRGAVPGHQYHLRVGQFLFEALKYAESVCSAHNDVAKDHPPVALAQHFKGPLGGLSVANFPPLVAEYVAYKAAHLSIVVNYQSLHKSLVPL